MKTELFKFTMPKEGICMEQNMYFRVDADAQTTVDTEGVTYDYENKVLRIHKGEAASFNTYFNLFSFSKYATYTNVNKVNIELELKGKLRVYLYASRIYRDEMTENILQEKEVDFSEKSKLVIEQSMTFDKVDGYYFVKIKALDDGVCFYGGTYYADVDRINDAQVAVVICTYRREDFVYRNIERVKEDIYKDETCSIRDNVSFYIIDNGKTLDKSRLEEERITVFENKNYGGSGGFTRGVFEAFSRKDTMTHVLLMDDDILFDCSVLEKTINFIKVLKEQHIDVTLGGAMLRLDKQNLMNDVGGYWNGSKIVGMRGNIDLTSLEELLRLEVSEFPTFIGWWFSCMPLCIIKEDEFPLPLFIKWDDVEYGSRVIKKMISINGIGIWHEYFDYKFSMHLDYYEMRNRLIVSAVHKKKLNKMSEMYYLHKKVLRALYMQRYEQAEFLIRGYNDFLRGVDFVKELNEEDLNRELMSHNPKMVYGAELPQKYHVNFLHGEYDAAICKKEGKLKRIWRVITLNGNLIPKVFYKKRDTGYNIVDMVKCRPINFYKERSVLQYNIVEGRGYVSEISKARFWSVIGKYYGLFFRYLAGYGKAYKSYRDRYHEITTYDFWKKHLEL